MIQLAWHAASAPADGERISGDAYVVRPAPDGYLLAVADGLGHGPDASRAAKQAIAIVTDTVDVSPTAIIRRCHSACVGSRGVVMTVVRIDTRNEALLWAGVGNVEAVLVRGRRNGGSGRETAMLPGGVVGVALPPLREQAYELQPGDVVAVATDGIRGAFVSELTTLGSLPDATSRIIARHRVATDDALVVLARCEVAP